MLKLNKQDYDLDNLLGFNFDMLKEILMKLCKNQSNIDSELNDIRESDEKRDKKISDLDKKLRELTNLNNRYNMKLNEMRKKSPLEKETDINNIKNTNKNDENRNINDDKNKDSNKDDNKEDGNNDNKNDDNNLEKENDKRNENENKSDEDSQIKEVDEDNEEKENELDNSQINQLEKIKENELNSENPNINDDNKSKEKIKRKNMSQNKLSFYKIMGNEKQKENVKRPLYRTSQQIIDLNSIVMRKTQVSYDVVKKILHTITEMNDKINFLEDSLYKKFNESLENSKKLLTDHNLQSKSKFDSINNKIEKLFSKSYETNRNVDELFSKYDELAQKLEDIPSKNIDLMDIIKDKNEEDDEEKKLMSNTLKDSIFEKFELNENRFLQEAGEHNKLKQILSKIQGYTDRLYRQINLLKQDNKNMKEDIDLFKENVNEVIDNKNEELKKEIKEDINNNINDINNNLDKKLRELLDYLLGKLDINEKNNNNNNAEEDENINNKIDKALTALINKKVNEIIENIERIEEDIKNSKKREVLKNKEIEEMKQNIAEINIILKNKIGSHNLNELYDFYLDNVNEVKNIRLKIEELTGIQERMKDQTPHFIKRLETLTHDVLELQENGSQKVISSGKPVDLSNYINEKKLKNALNPIIEQIQKLTSDSKYLNITIKELTEQISSFEKKEHIDHIESEFNEKITLLSIKFAKKYLEKLEFIKIIKNIEIQLKLLQGNGPKQDNDSNWLIANKPLKCFNCATCEANVSNSVSPNEYIPWNRYPYGDKQYWIGQGFSKLLQKINRRIDDNNNKNNLDFDNSNKFLGNSMNNANEIIKINNKMRKNEENHSPINIKKYKLPKVIENSRKKQKSVSTLPVKDDEKENVEDIIDNDVGVISPQILKITKLNNQSSTSQTIQVQESNDFQRNKSSKSTGKTSSQLNRVQSAPMY